MLALPFAAIYSTPLLIYLGTIGPQQYARAFILQGVWLVVFAGAAALMWQAARRRVVVQGG
jgi:ABC-2 type transport system permease protein